MSKIEKILVITTSLLTMTFVLAAAIGIPYNNGVRDRYMPSEIQFLIKVNENKWPDWFYSGSYSSENRSFHLNTYWTFEPSKLPLSSALWVYHSYALDMKDVNFEVISVNK
jgi:hypothetical protein